MDTIIGVMVCGQFLMNRGDDMTTMSEYGDKINRPLCEIVGLSTDTKPIDIIEGIYIQNGSRFIEMDTDKKYLFDAVNKQWKEVD